MVDVLLAPLQTRPNPVAPTLQLLVVLNIIAWPSVIALVCLPNCTMRKLHQRRQQQQQQQLGNALDAAGASSQCRESRQFRDQDDAYVFTSNGSRGSLAEQQDDSELGQACKPQQQRRKEEEQQQQQQGWRQRAVGFVKAQAMPSAIGSIACLYNLVNIYATKFTTSYLVQVRSGPTAGCCCYIYCLQHGPVLCHMWLMLQAGRVGVQ
jgi:hypothetical protein